MKLYEISEKYREVLSELESIDGLDEQIIADTLSPYKDDLDNKCLAIGAMIKNLKAEKNAVSEAVASLKKREAAIVEKIGRITRYLADHIPGPLRDGQVRIAPIPGRGHVVVRNIDALPEHCIKVERSAILKEVKDILDTLPSDVAAVEFGPSSVRIT